MLTPMLHEAALPLRFGFLIPWSFVSEIFHDCTRITASSGVSVRFEEVVYR